MAANQQEFISNHDFSPDEIDEPRVGAKPAEINPIAYEREMPDYDVLERVRKSGVNEAMRDYKPEKGTTIIRTKKEARRVIKILYEFSDRIHAWDTETFGIDPKEESPVVKGQVLCAQVFAGPDVDFGNGPRLFIDNYADAAGVINEFKEYFEDPKILKCWHNYGFDRHILFNHGIDVKGFGGDTMHMARLADPSKLRYALKVLTEEMEPEIIQTKQSYNAWLIDALETQLEAASTKSETEKLQHRIQTVKHFSDSF